MINSPSEVFQSHSEHISWIRKQGGEGGVNRSRICGGGSGRGGRGRGKSEGRSNGAAAAAGGQEKGKGTPKPNPQGGGGTGSVADTLCMKAQQRVQVEAAQAALEPTLDTECKGPAAGRPLAPPVAPAAAQERNLGHDTLSPFPPYLLCFFLLLGGVFLEIATQM